MNNNLERPEVPSNLETIEVGSRTVKIAWKRPFDGNSPVLSYVVQYQHHKSGYERNTILNYDVEWRNPTTMNLTVPVLRNTVGADGNMKETAVVTGLSPATTYALRMLAENEIAKSMFSDSISFKTQEEAPTESPYNIQGNNNSSVVYYCKCKLPRLIVLSFTSFLFPLLPRSSIKFSYKF